MSKKFFVLILLLLPLFFTGKVYAYDCNNTSDPAGCSNLQKNCEAILDTEAAVTCYNQVKSDYPLADKCQDPNNFDIEGTCVCEGGKPGKTWGCTNTGNDLTTKFFKASGPNDPYNGSCFNVCGSKPEIPTTTSSSILCEQERDHGNDLFCSRKYGSGSECTPANKATDDGCTAPAAPTSPNGGLTAEEITGEIVSKCGIDDDKCMISVRNCLAAERGDISKGIIGACFELYLKTPATPKPATPKPAAPAAPRTPISPTEEEGPGCDGVDSVWGIWEKGEDGKFSKLKEAKRRSTNDPDCGFKLSQAQQDEIAALERDRSKAAQQDQVIKRTVTAVKVNGRDVGTKNPKVPLNLLDICKDDFFAGKCIVTVEYFYSSGDPTRIALKLKPASSLTNKESGQSCNKTAQCKQGLICIGDDDAREFGLPKDRCYPNPKVTTKLSDGADCVSNSQCVSGDCRTGGTCDTAGGCKGKCIGGGKPGEFCRHDSECPSGYFCPGEDESRALNTKKDTCTPLSVRTSGGGSPSSGGGGSSSSGSSCGTVQREPHGNKCLGDTCSDDPECKTGYCCTGSSCTNQGKCTNANGSI